MRLIEKKCPNCGANLEFDENDKSCKCQYCKRSFEIERDMNDLEKFNLVFDKVQQPVKAFFFIPFIFAFVVIVIIMVSIFSFNHSDVDHNSSSDIEEVEEEKNPLIVDASELTNSNMDFLEQKAFSVISQSVTGRSDTTYSYQKTGEPRLEKTYVASKEDGNAVILIYKVMYHNFFNQSDVHTVFVPAVFEDVHKNLDLSKPKNPAPEYYFNSEKSTYIYAYGSLDDAYNNVVKPYEGDYKISEK